MQVQIDWDDGTTEVCAFNEIRVKAEEANANGVTATSITQVDEVGCTVPDAIEFGIEWIAYVVRLTS